MELLSKIFKKSNFKENTHNIFLKFWLFTRPSFSYCCCDQTDIPSLYLVIFTTITKYE